jgi:hypothetical protein
VGGPGGVSPSPSAKAPNYLVSMAAAAAAAEAEAKVAAVVSSDVHLLTVKSVGDCNRSGIRR